LDGVDLKFDADVFDFIVNLALEYKLGARGLRSICEAILNDAMFDLPSDKNIKTFRVDLGYAQSKFAGSKLSKLKIA
jgi:ATP-dependent Clp protease ATP-binding subunit ClpX